MTGRHLIDEDMKIIITLAIINKKCTKLRLGQNEITSAGASILADALLHNDTLEELSLWNNNLYDIGVQSLAKMLAINKNVLKKLDLSKNGITDAGVEHLALMLKTNRILTHLSLCRNEISDHGIRSLVSTIQNRYNTVQVLSLSDNKLITDSCVDPLIDMIEHNRALTKLWINDCQLSQSGKTKLRNATTSKKNLRVYM